MKVALVGIGGYGDSYVRALLDAQAGVEAAGVELIGAVDPDPQRCPHLDELRRRRIPIHNDLDLLYADARPDLVMMATPIHLHAAHTCFALERGSHVLCEKPLAATVRDARRIVTTERRSGGRFVAVGYQWSYSRPIQNLKQDIIDGVLGRPIRLKSLVMFPRGLDYFRRNDWAGRIRTQQGDSVFDSPVNNATAHYLHNMFYLLGRTRQSSAMPTSVQAELYRANDIENYDTAALRVTVDCGAELLFYTTHAVPPKLGPILNYEFERATVTYEAETGAGLIARFRDGRIKHYGEPNHERNQKIWQSIEAARQSSASSIACGAQAAMAHVRCVAAAQLSMPQITRFPATMLTRESDGANAMICVNGLHAALVQCYDQSILPAEHGGLDWATPAQIVRLAEGSNSADEDAANIGAASVQA